MSMQQQDKELIESAFSVFPKAVYLLTAGFEDKRGGMLVPFVQRCCNEPAMICVAARKGHTIDPLIRDSHAFALGVLSEGDRLIERRFLRSDVPPRDLPAMGDDDPFDAIETKTLVTGSPIIPRCKVWFDCEVARRVDLEAEMELFVGVVVGVMLNGKKVRIDRTHESDD